MSLIEQLELEKRMLEIGTKRFLEKVEDDGINLDSAPIKKLIDVLLLPFAETLDVFIKAELKSKNKRKNALTKILGKNSREGVKITALDLSFITTASIFNNIFDYKNGFEYKHRLVNFTSKLGSNINQNLELEFRFGENDSFRVGNTLVRLFAQQFEELCSVEHDFFDRDSKNKEYIVIFTEDFSQFISETIEAIADMTVAIYPMVFKPEEWDEKGHNGGWYSTGLKRNMVKHRNLKEHAGVNQLISNSINLIQNTPWEVNIEIKGIIDRLETSHGDLIKKVFPKEIPEDPCAPFDDKIKWGAMTDDQKKEHSAWRAKIKKNDRNRKAKQSVDYTRVAAMRQAEQFSGSPKIYFPHDLDYRERNYSISQTGLSTQGSDTQKGLIKFANPRLVETDGGARWMKINMANLTGQDKLKLDDRVSWVESNEVLIRECVCDPIKTLEIWSNWDKPIQGMAAAIEYVKWLDYPELGVKTHVQLDGLCNGVQHLSALTRDHKVAPHVGLVQTEERGDVYQYVCDAVIDIIKSDKSKFAKEWLVSDLLDRSLTKKPVMTRSYAAKLHGIKTGVADFIEDAEATRKFEEYRKAGFWMGDRIWEAMGESLSGPMMFLDWVQACAKVIGQANKPFIWHNPYGGRCYQAPVKTKIKRIELRFEGKRIQHQLQTPTDKIDVSKLESSCSPNVVHSCDASHLMSTVNLSNARGVTDFAMVHDSFGCAPDDAPILLEECKNAWVNQYETNWLEVWYQEWFEQLGPEVGAYLPHWSEFITLGELNIKDVIESDFFFA